MDTTQKCLRFIIDTAVKHITQEVLINLIRYSVPVLKHVSSIQSIRTGEAAQLQKDSRYNPYFVLFVLFFFSKAFFIYELKTIYLLSPKDQEHLTA